MDKEEFELEYININEIKLATYSEYFVTLKCQCGDKLCKGWSAVANNQIAINAHNNLYN